MIMGGETKHIKHYPLTKNDLACYYLSLLHEHQHCWPCSNMLWTARLNSARSKEIWHRRLLKGARLAISYHSNAYLDPGLLQVSTMKTHAALCALAASHLTLAIASPLREQLVFSTDDDRAAINDDEGHPHEWNVLHHLSGWVTNSHASLSCSLNQVKLILYVQTCVS